jgi:hypothetical protein
VKGTDHVWEGRPYVCPAEVEQHGDNGLADLGVRWARARERWVPILVRCLVVHTILQQTAPFMETEGLRCDSNVVFRQEDTTLNCILSTDHELIPAGCKRS